MQLKTKIFLIIITILVIMIFILLRIQIKNQEKQICILQDNLQKQIQNTNELINDFESNKLELEIFNKRYDSLKKEIKKIEDKDNCLNKKVNKEFLNKLKQI